MLCRLKTDGNMFYSPHWLLLGWRWSIVVQQTNHKIVTKHARKRGKYMPNNQNFMTHGLVISFLFRWFFQNVNVIIPISTLNVRCFRQCQLVHSKVKPGHSHRFGKQSSQSYDCPSFCNLPGTRRRCGSCARGTCDRRNGGRRGSRRLDLRWKGDLWQRIVFFCRKRGGLLWLDFAAWAARTYTMNVV